MSDIFPVPESIAKTAHCDDAAYKAMYQRSIDDPEAFWAEQAKRLDWTTFPSKIKDVDYADNARIRWYEDGVLNVSYNCIDRHLATRGDQTAILWEGDEPTQDKKVTYKELHEQVCRLANVMKGLGVKKGDRVTLYMPMIPEAAYAMLACARIGAVHSIVFGGFSPDSLADRIKGLRQQSRHHHRWRQARWPQYSIEAELGMPRLKSARMAFRSSCSNTPARTCRWSMAVITMPTL